MKSDSTAAVTLSRLSSSAQMAKVTALRLLAQFRLAAFPVRKSHKRLAVHGDEEGLVAKRFDVLTEMVRHEPGDLRNTLLPLEKILQIHRPVENLVQLLDEDVDVPPSGAGGG